MKAKILITVRGGMIQAIASTSADVEITVADYDNIENGPGELFTCYKSNNADGIISESEFNKRLAAMEKEDTVEP